MMTAQQEQGQAVEATMFNAERKQAFLSTILKESTREDYKRLLEKCSPFESSMSKDVSHFNMAEFTSLMKYLKPSTLSNSRTYGHILSSYWTWAKNQGIRQFNPLADIGRDWWNQFSSEEVKEYYSFDEIMEISNSCHNPQDSAVFLMLFEGVQGKDLVEIASLKGEDILPDALRLTARRKQNGDVSYVGVHPRTVKALREALKQMEYYKEDDGNVRLISNDYVFRNTIGARVKNDAPMRGQTVRSRIESIRNSLGSEYQNLTAKDVVRSGMIYYAKTLMDLYGEINKEVLDKVAEKFNTSNIWNMKDYLNEKVISDLYGN